jgi:uncharacterized membrane protein HdeD (DUF308 family)
MVYGTNLLGVDELRKNWGWLMALGVGLLILGLIATSASFATTYVTIIFFGVLLLIGGAFEISNAFRHQNYSGFFMHLLTGVLDVVCGGILLAYPAAGAAALTLILALFFLVGGAMRIFSSLFLHLPNTGWAILSGAVDVVLGFLLLSSWPVSALWFLGFCVGMGLLFRGAWWTAFALSMRGTPSLHKPSRA